jgi:hypothetical protein
MTNDSNNTNAHPLSSSSSRLVYVDSDVAAVVLVPPPPPRVPSRASLLRVPSSRSCWCACQGTRHRRSEGDEKVGKSEGLRRPILENLTSENASGSRNGPIRSLCRAMSNAH